MNEPDRTKRLAIVVGVLAEAYRREITDVTIKAYEMGLQGVPIADIERAAQRAVETCKFMPVPSELRELAGGLTPKQRAVLAWGAFKRAADTHGFYASVDFDDQVVNATVRNLGGWMPVLDQMEAEGEKWIRKDFERVYEAFAVTGIGPDLARPLLGLHEQQNIENGYHDAIKPPVLVITGLPVRKRIETQVQKPTPEVAGLLENALRSPNPKGT
jgi:hypothetical protein